MVDNKALPEHSKYDDSTGIDSFQKEKGFETLYNGIFQICQNANEWDIISEDINSIDLDEIDEYLKTLPRRQDLPIKLPLIVSADISDTMMFSDLCDHTGVSPKQDFPYDKKRIYFLETADTAVTIIPIRTDYDTIHIHMELFHMSPEFIQLIQKDASGKKEFDRKKFKKASELEPKPKPRT